MIIGAFNYDKQDDTYTGRIITLTFERNGIIVRPVSKSGESGPDYRVMREAEGDSIEFGAAWKRTSDKGQDFLSVLLDDPALPRPINAALFRDVSHRTARLLWTRAKPRAPTTEPGQPERPLSQPRRARPSRKPQNG